MTQADDHLARLQSLVQTTTPQAEHLQRTDQRLFSTPFNADRAQELDHNIDLAESAEAFASRFARLQDALGNKLVPVLLRALNEPLGAAMDNLDRAEQLGWIQSADQWIHVRKWRNRMVHEYIDDPAILADALQTGHEAVAMLVSTQRALREETRRRG